LFLYFDTETSDFSDPTNPSLPVEFAAVLGDEERVVATLSVVLSQTQWVGVRVNPIAQRVIDIHGISPRLCADYGEAPVIVLEMFRRMVAKAHTVVAHNVDFDLVVMNHAFATMQLPPVAWPRVFCTMRGSAPVLRIPSGGRYAIGGYKAPKLAEAYRYFAKKDLQNAHNALTDVYACRLVHRGLLRLETAERQRQRLVADDASGHGDATQQVVGSAVAC
jgi:DNA polymerase-3 subunit epsilon